MVRSTKLSENSEKTHAIIYLRVSDKYHQDEQNQLNDCIRFSSEKGISDPEIIREKISAFKNPNRESMKKLEQFDIIIIWKYDRLQRNRKKFVELMKLYSAKGIEIYSVTEPWLNELHKIPTPWNEILYDMMVQLVGWMAEDESQKRSDRTKAGLVVAKQKGKKLGRRPKKLNFKKVWDAYESMGSINKAHKILPYGYGTVYKIITNEIHNQKDWENLSKKDR